MPFTNFPIGVSNYGDPRSFWNAFGKTYFLDGNQGSDNNDGSSPDYPYLTMAAVLDRVVSGDTIIMRGNINENVTTPAGVFDVTVIGSSNKPRHADSHSGNGGFSGVTWGKSPASSSDPLITVIQQGWSFYNILFECPATDAGILFTKNASSGDDEQDGGHGTVYGCRFDGGVNSGQDGIVVSGGSGFFLFENNFFRGLGGDGIGSVTGSGAGTNSWWQIRNNIFEQNDEHVNVAADHCFILNNVFGAFTTTGMDLSGGTVGLNQVHGNYLDGDYDAGYVAGTTDDWAGNYSEDITSGEVADNGITVTQPVA